MQTRLIQLIDILEADTRSGDRRRDITQHDELFAAVPKLLQAGDYRLTLRGIRVLASLYDSRGDHTKAAECLNYLRDNGERDRIRERIHSRDLRWTSDRALVKEQLLLIAEDNTSLLRHGEREPAKRWTAELLLCCLPDDLSEETREIKIRANHLMGRILQTTGHPDESERYFAAALEQCQFWIVVSSGKSNAAFAYYQAGLAVAGLARSALDQGSLSRAYRQLLVAKIFLAPTLDRVAGAYVEFLMGCYERQTNQLERAWARLRNACESFDTENHQRLYRRASLELAQAFYNAGKVDDAESILRKLDGRREHSGDAGDETTRQRWSGTRGLLEARLKLKRNDPQAAERYAQTALDELGKNWSDQTAVACAILADAAVMGRKYALAIRHANAGLMARNGKEPPLDVVDHAWLLLALAEAHKQRNDVGDIYDAQRCLDRCNALPLENELMKQRRDRLVTELHAIGIFQISREEPDLDYYKWEGKLKRFLYDRARERTPGAKPEDYADRLGISRATYFKWVKWFTSVGKP